MPAKPRRLYWDANVFIHYIEGTPTHLPTLDTLLHTANTTGTIEIYTSMASIAEVAYHAQEKVRGVLSPGVKDAIDAFWDDRSANQLADVSQLVVIEARDLIRFAIAQGWTGLKPMDAIHLATARRLKVDSFQTYERAKLDKYGPHIGCVVEEPMADQPMLPLGGP